MEYGGMVQQDCGGGLFGTLGEADHHMIEELLAEGCWVEASSSDNCNNQELNLMMQQTTPPVHEYMNMGGGGGGDQAEEQHQILIQVQDDEAESSSFVVGKRWWIGPRGVGGPSSSVKERLVVAVRYLKDYTKNTNVVIQIWVPPRRRSHSHYHHTTTPKLLDDSVSVGLGFSNNHHNNIDHVVRFFRSHEYPRVQQQQQYGSLALPVFERGSGTCLGVLEILMTNQTILDYRPQLDHLSNNSLEAVDFRSGQNFIPPALKVFDELYQAAVSEIVEVLTCVCKTHNLPLALTWAPCIQQGKGAGCGVSTEISCVSTVESACYVGDVDILGFQEACSEYHLFHGQGIVGTAFTTTKPCFAIDITAFSKAEYPLAHHAKMFGLHAAVAIPLRSVYTGSAADFVLEFFLPRDCHDGEEQKQMLNSLSLVVQQACRSLHVVLMEDEFALPLPLPPNIMPPAAAAAPSTHIDHPSQSEARDIQSSSSSWIAHMMEAQHKGKGVSVSLEYLQEPKEEFKVTTNWDRDSNTTTTSVSTVFSSDFGQLEQQSMDNNSRGSSVEGGGEGAMFGAGGGRRSSSSCGGRKAGDKRRTKAEKTISLPVLRQYFAGSLKDAAKSIGVCPTTLKRICRQHGITRWPSRKIKKVGHSLKKLQLVIDSVQGAEGAIQIGSFYAAFPELSTSAACTNNSDQSSTKKMHIHHHHHHIPIPDNNGFYVDGLVTNSPACSQTQTQTQTSAFAINHQVPSSTVINNSGAVSVSNNSGGDHVVMTEGGADAFLIRRAHSEADLLHASINLQDQDTKTKHFNTQTHDHHHQSSSTLPPPPPPPPCGGWNINNNSNTSPSVLERGAFRVKATFADEKIRFSLQPVWGFRELQQEIARRFNLSDMSSSNNNMVVKYVDDEGEWVVLGCDADLEECKDLHRSSHTRTIRLSLFQASPLHTFRNSSSPS